MKKLIVILAFALSFWTSRDAAAASCWQVTGWSSTNVVGAQASLIPTDCTTVPLTHGWTQVIHNAPPDLWLRISLTDPRVTNGVFSPILVFAGYNGQTPIVVTDLLPCNGCPNTTPLVYTPPVQGTPIAGSRVRLRHEQSGKCMTTSSTNGERTLSAACAPSAAFTFVVDAAGSGLVRLRNLATSQCLYAGNTDGGFLWHWGCWNDPYMRFALDPAGGGFRLRHHAFSQCAYDFYDGVHTWGCWADPAMVYKVDIIQY